LATRSAPTLPDVEAARARLSGVARVTPVYSSEYFSHRADRDVWLKAENLQRTGSFKIRGAYNCIASLSAEERAAGVVAASAGNHGQAVAWAARELGVAATVFMPVDAPMAKVDATRNYGAQVELVGEAFDDAYAAAQEWAQEPGATFVAPFEDERVIAGQGTLGLELAEQLPELGAVLVPVGGGGLCSGIALALRERRPDVRVIGVQAAACAPLAGGTERAATIADGIAVKHPGVLTASILADCGVDVIAVSEEEIAEAILLVLERTKLLVEGAGAAGVAALLSGKAKGEGPLCVVLSGGNIDPSLLITVMRHGLTRAGRYLVVRTQISDRPGELLKLLGLVAEERVNVISVEHHREGMSISVGATEVELTLGARDEEHCAALLATMSEWGYTVERLR
jgi:threonine dehydratase